MYVPPACLPASSAARRVLRRTLRHTSTGVGPRWRLRAVVVLHGHRHWGLPVETGLGGSVGAHVASLARFTHADNRTPPMLTSALLYADNRTPPMPTTAHPPR